MAITTETKLTDLSLEIWAPITRHLKIEDVCRVVQVCWDLREKSAYLFQLKARALGLKVDRNEAQEKFKEIGSLIYLNCFNPVVKSLGVEDVFLLPLDNFDAIPTKILELVQSVRGSIFRSNDYSSIAFCCEDSALAAGEDRRGILLITPSSTAPAHWVSIRQVAPIELNPNDITSDRVTQLISGQPITLNSADGNTAFQGMLIK
jgi:hypothetical protein